MNLRSEGLRSGKVAFSFLERSPLLLDWQTIIYLKGWPSYSIPIQERHNMEPLTFVSSKSPNLIPYKMSPKNISITAILKTLFKNFITNSLLVNPLKTRSRLSSLITIYYKYFFCQYFICSCEDKEFIRDWCVKLLVVVT
jgi:hypothetical protein